MVEHQPSKLITRVRFPSPAPFNMNFEIVLATTNQHKADEYRALLSKHGITLYSFKDLNLTLPKVKEDGKTFLDNALIKAKAAAKIVNMPVLADDSGLCIKALNDFPGIKTARFAKKCGSQINANHKIVNMLKYKDHSASFHCVIALLNVKKEPLIFIGNANGKISDEYHNEESFGYDPIFISDEVGTTFHLMDKKKKNEVSHRAKACKKLITALKLYGYIK